MPTAVPRIPLVHGPTPIVRMAALDALVGCRVHVKRDDMTGGAEAGNKLRKLEYFLADAQANAATTLVTCGALQSNHARATALVAARFGLRSLLLLRCTEGPTDPWTDADDLPAVGNVALARLVGARIRRISASDYRQRTALLLESSQEIDRNGGRGYVIPEGGSNGLGSLGYVRAAEEIAWQVRHGAVDAKRFAEVVVACGSGGTVAGLALGAARTDVYQRVRAALVCDDARYFEGVVRRIVQESRAWDDTLGDVVAPVLYDESSRGPRYGEMDPGQKDFLVDVARNTGLILDPVYTGKALYALRLARERRDLGPKDDVLFLHTGGLPGFLATAADLPLGGVR